MNFNVMFNKTDYAILELLVACECDAPMESMSKKAIIRRSELSHVKVQQVLKAFMLSGFVKEGTKDGNNKTYFYTEEGKEHLMSAFGYLDGDIDDLVVKFKELTIEYNKMIIKEQEELERIKAEQEILKENNDIKEDK